MIERPQIAKVACGSCQVCCKGEIIFLHPEEGDEPSRYMTRMVKNPISGEVQAALMQKPNGDCVYLSETGCTIYGRHPKICRTFDCVRFTARMDEIMRDLRGAEKRRFRRNMVGTAYEVGKAKADD